MTTSSTASSGKPDLLPWGSGSQGWSTPSIPLCPTARVRLRIPCLRCMRARPVPLGSGPWCAACAQEAQLGPPLPPQCLFHSPKRRRHTCTTRHVQLPLTSGFTLKREMFYYFLHLLFSPIIFSTSVHLFYSHPLPSHLKEEMPPLQS